jgi:catechol 2,3-dioxygenase-like lactoylglutathione lyase family enzyme
LIQEAPAEGAPAGNVHRVSLAYTMESADATKNFYTGMLALELSGSPAYSQDATMLKLYGAPAGAEFRKLSGVLPGPNVPVEFTEFRGVTRSKVMHVRVRDIGAPAMAINVANLQPMVDQMKAAGVPLISVEGKLVDFGNGVRNIFVEDPNGMNLELVERPAGAGKGKAK